MFARYQRLQGSVRTRSDKADLAHVTHIEERGAAARLPVLGDVASG